MSPANVKTLNINMYSLHIYFNITYFTPSSKNCNLYMKQNIFTDDHLG